MSPLSRFFPRSVWQLSLSLLWGFTSPIMAATSLDASGNWTVTGGGNGDITAANWHQSLTVQSGASMGFLDLTSNPSSFTISVGNSGSMSGTNAIVGGATGVFTLNNSGSLSGTVLGNGGNVVVTNNTSGSISGDSGIDAFTGGVLNLNNQGTITGLSNDAVTALHDSIILNSGTIHALSGSVADGLDLFNHSNITNTTTGIISGADDGIDAADQTTLTNSGQITGNGDGSRGVSVWSSSTITNNASGTILATGAGGIGVQMLDTGSLTNRGTIQADDGHGVVVGFDATIINSGSIKGLLSGDGIKTDGGTFSLNNEAGGLVQGAVNGVTINGLLTTGLTHITNSGTIQADGGHGINADGISDLGVLNNASGVIRATGGAGVAAGDNLTFTNNGQVHGDTDGVLTSGGLLKLNNTGVVDGANGVQVINDLDLTAGPHITNTGAAALIKGTAGAGVLAQGSFMLHNLSGATIQSVGGDAVHTGFDLNLKNDASHILGDSGGGSGVYSAGGILQVQNLAGADIQGQRGIWVAGDLAAGALAHNIRNEGASLIAGLSGHGIEALDNLMVGNVGGSTIQSTGGDGIFAGNNASILNTQASFIRGDASSGSGINAAGTTVQIQNLQASTIQGASGIMINTDATAPASGPNILNDGSTIKALAGDGINAQGNLVVHNLSLGKITALGGNGVNAGIDLTVINDGASLIQGDATMGQGIQSSGGALVIQNLGASTINGAGGIAITGDTTGTGPHVLNTDASTIQGLTTHGIAAQNDLIVHNLSSSVIRSSGGDGINALANLTVQNDSAQIQGDAATGNGILATGGAFSLFNTNAGTVTGATSVNITGDVTPLAGGAAHVLNEFSSIIEGKAGDGITGQSGLVITNQTDGVIKSTNGNGITAVDSLRLQNLTGGSIQSTNGNGVFTGIDATILNNASTIHGDLASGSGIVSGGGAFTLRNLVGSGVDGQRGVVFTGNLSPLTVGEAHVLNDASTITGHDGHGVEALNGLWLINQNAAVISGINGNGILAGNHLSAVNSMGSLISGTVNGIEALDSGGITNYGSITGTTQAGIASGNELVLMNNNGGVVTGGTDGVVTLDSSMVTNWGTIKGTTQNGMTAGDILDFTNGATGILLGATNGAVVGATATITNEGHITGTTEAGVSAGGTLTLTNDASGIVTGNTDAVEAGGQARVTNSGRLDAGSGAAVQALDLLILVNNSTGRMTGTLGVETLGETSAGGASITNHGTIIVTDRAIVTGPGNDFVDQYGTLKSGSGTDMMLGAGDDLVILHNGVVSTGRIIGQGHIVGDRLVLDGAVRIEADVLQVERTDTNGPGVSTIVRGVILESDVVSVNSGWLHLDGLIRGSVTPFASVTVQPWATLSGNGVIQGDLRMAPHSTITPGDLTPGSIGMLTVRRDFRMDHDSVYIADLDAASGRSDLVRVGGTASIRGRLVLQQHGTFERGDRFTVVAAHSVKGRFSSIENADITPLLGFVQQVGHSTIDVEAQAHWQDIAGLTPHEHTIAAYLDGITSQGTDQLHRILTALDYSDAANVKATLSQMDPVIYAAPATLAMQHAHQAQQNLTRHLEQVRRPMPQGDGGPDAPESSQDGLMRVRLPMTLWFDVGGASYDQDAFVETNGFTASMASLTVGADVEFSDRWTLGGSLSLYDDQFNAGPWGSKGDSQAIVLGGHATHGFGTGWYQDASLSAGYGQSDVHHVYRTVPFVHDARADYGSFLWQGSLGTGYRWEREGWKFGPLARFAYAGIYENEVNEHGSGGLDQRIDERLRQSARFEVGFTAQHHGWTLGTLHVKPAASFLYAHEFIKQSSALTSSLIDAGMGSFTVRALDTPDDSVLGSLGLMIEVTSETTITLGYTIEQELGRHAAVRHAGGVSVGVRF